eukprot:COSAG04_NODE_14848_length_553_cov_0.715859_2_plen_76_part_01
MKRVKGRRREAERDAAHLAQKLFQNCAMAQKIVPRHKSVSAKRRESSRRRRLVKSGQGQKVPLQGVSQEKSALRED